MFLCQKNLFLCQKNIAIKKKCITFAVMYDKRRISV